MYRALQRIQRCAQHISFSNGDYRLAEERKLGHTHQQVSYFKGQQKMVLHVELGRENNDFWQRSDQERFCGTKSDVTNCLLEVNFFAELPTHQLS